MPCISAIGPSKPSPPPKPVKSLISGLLVYNPADQLAGGEQFFLFAVLIFFLKLLEIFSSSVVVSSIANKGSLCNLIIGPFYPMAQGPGDLRHLNADASNYNDQELDILGASSEPQAPSAEFSLPPVDTGREAWLFLAACWGVEALTFGEILHS